MLALAPLVNSAQFRDPVVERSAITGVAEEYMRTRKNALLPNTDKFHYSFVSHHGGKPFTTACWTYDWTQKAHRVFMGKGIWTKARNAATTTTDLQGYYAAFYRHEFGHALFTERNHKAISEALDKDKIPFSLFNLFEDARIEHAIRNNLFTKFNWKEYEDVALPKTAIQRFFQLIQQEAGDRRSYRKAYAWDASVTVDKNLRQVDRFYKMAIKCKSTMELFPLMKSWMKKFPMQTGMDCDHWRQVDITENSLLDQDFTIVDADGKHIPYQDAPEVAASDKEQNGMVAGFGKELSNPINSASIDSRFIGFLSQSLQGIRKEVLADSIKQVPSIAKRLMANFEATESLQATTDPGGKIHLSNMIMGRREIYTEVVKGRSFTPPRVSVFLDCSGSMCHAHTETLLLPLLFNYLARMGAIKANLVLTKIDNSTNHAVNARAKLPVIDDAILGIAYDGRGEGIQKAFEANESMLRSSNMVICVTDGNLTDNEVDKAHWNRMGVKSIGCYIGDPANAHSLHQYFDQHLIKPDFVSMANALAVLLRYLGRSAKPVSLADPNWNYNRTVEMSPPERLRTNSAASETSIKR